MAEGIALCKKLVALIEDAKQKPEPAPALACSRLWLPSVMELPFAPHTDRGVPVPKLKPSVPGPRTQRPNIPGYGISTKKADMLPWKWAEKTLTDSREYWMVTVRPDGRAHAMIIWGLWFDGAFWFGTVAKLKRHETWQEIPIVLSVLKMPLRQ